MGAYPRGTAINLVEEFWTIDPVTEVATLADPTTVTFEVASPDGTVVQYVFGVDGNVTNPSVGVYVCALDPPPPGTYTYRVVGTGAVQAESGDKTFLVTDSSIDPVPETVPELGPCQPWITGDDVAACGADLGVGSDFWLLDNVAQQGSALAWELSGRKYPGLCVRTVRPCSSACEWGSIAAGTRISWMSSFWNGGWGGWGWYDDYGSLRCGCSGLSTVKLSGYPVREILSVTIDGVVLAAVDADGNPNYRLDNRRDLVRMDTPGTPVVKNYWPSCQNLALASTEAGTFEVSYRWGMEPPPLGKAAAAALARELYLACTGSKCSLPTRVTKVVRQGVTLEKIVSTANLFRTGSTGIQLLDAFLAFANPTKMRRRPAVFSPDVQKYAKKVGQ